MFGSSYRKRLHQLFDDQFEANESGYIYRRYRTGAAIRVTRSERDVFISEYRSRTRLARWLLAPAMVVLVGLMIWLFPDMDSARASTAMYVGIGVIAVAFMVAFRSAWNAPARDLAGRQPIAPARSRAEGRALALSAISWRQLAAAFLFAGVLALRALPDSDGRHGAHLWWAVLSSALTISILVQMVRKWRFQRRPL